MVSREFLARDIVGHGAYLCLRRADGGLSKDAARALDTLRLKLGLRNEFDPGRPPARGSFALLRRHAATPRDVADPAVSGGRRGGPRRVAARRDRCRVLRRSPAGACARRAGAGARGPGASQELHGRGHGSVGVRARRRAAAGGRHAQRVLRPAQQDRGLVDQGLDGAPHLLPPALRRPGTDGQRGTRALTYFECSDADVPTFHRVCDALRDVARNPEWRFVREGPTWHGRRVASWDELFG